MNGMKVKNGRLINEMPNGITGIQKACEIKKEMKRAKKVAMYAEAIQLAGSKNLMAR